MRVLTSQRLNFRCFTNKDTALLMRVFSNPDVMRYSDNGVQNLPWVKNWLAATQKSYQENNYGTWAVIRQQDNTFIGYCGLEFVPDVAGRAEVALGYRFLPAYWGRGYASEAARACLDYGVGVLGLERIVAMIDPRNVASVRVAVKAGMVYGGDVMYAGYTHPDHVYVFMKR